MSIAKSMAAVQITTLVISTISGAACVERHTVMRNPDGSTFSLTPGTYWVQFRVPRGLPKDAGAFSMGMPNRAQADRVVFNDYDEDRFRELYEARGPTINDFRVTVDYRVATQGGFCGQVEVERYFPYRARWAMPFENKRGEPIRLSLPAPRQETIIMEIIDK